MKDAFRSVFIITVFTFSSQLILFVCQIVAASFFGAGNELDAFLAASTLPQYIISVLLGSLGFVFIPFFIDLKTNANQAKAYRLMVSIFNNCIVFLGLITVVGIIFAKPLLELTAPGLGPAALEIGVKVAIITWPTILASGALSFLTEVSIRLKGNSCGKQQSL
ncbi:MAG: lipid II flippase MurJ [Cytophagales bacterium]|nr:lipid II flippase MurJ [Cytophagales bacterium]